MAEICTPVKKLEEGTPYIPGPDEYVVTDKNSIADIVRWVIDENWMEDFISVYELWYKGKKK